MVRFCEVVVAVPEVGETDNQFPPEAVATLAMKCRVPELAVRPTSVLVVAVVPALTGGRLTFVGMTISEGAVTVRFTATVTGRHVVPPVHDSTADPDRTPAVRLVVLMVRVILPGDVTLAGACSQAAPLATTTERADAPVSAIT